jgi:cytochrome c2
LFNWQINKAVRRVLESGHCMRMPGLMGLSTLLGVALVLVAACSKPRPSFTNPEALLTLSHVTAAGKTERTQDYTKQQIADRSRPEVVEAFDPYYGKSKRFWAVPLAPLLSEAFSGLEISNSDFVIRALDGYEVPIRGSQLLEEGGYLALADMDAPAWVPVGPRKANPGPYYLVWSKPEQSSLETHPRPWQVRSIEMVPFERSHPHVIPARTPKESPAWAGLSTFKSECIRCHAINREGGRVGPELNVPQNILEYRSEAQVRAYIKDPKTFRYGAMPAHPGLTEANLDELMAYLRVMSQQKHDSEANKP